MYDHMPDLSDHDGEDYDDEDYEYDDGVEQESESVSEQPDTMVGEELMTIDDSGLPDPSEVTQEDTAALSGEDQDGIAPSMETEAATWRSHSA